MLLKYDTLSQTEQEKHRLAQQITRELEVFLAPLLLILDELLDKRLLRTCMQSMVAIIRFRNHKQGLLLSELGSYMDSSDGLSETAPAGTKRLGNFIRSLKWGKQIREEYLLDQADREVDRLKSLGKRVLCVWDGSVLEKPESEKLEGLSPVVSSKAKRLRKSRKGVVSKVQGGKPITGAGMHWIGAVITGMDGLAFVAIMDWWTTKGKYATKQRNQEALLRSLRIGKGGQLGIHVFDRGYASGPWLEVLQAGEAIFVIRWIKTHMFLDGHGVEKKLWEIGRGKRYPFHKVISDMSGQKFSCDLWWAVVRHASYASQLYYVKVRVGKSVWRLITNEPVLTEEQAWRVFFPYRRRWKIEMSFRYGKSELAMESPRLWSWENRLKILCLVVLLYSFLLHLLADIYSAMSEALLRVKCHRTAKRYKRTLVPLYRIRWALSRLWDDACPIRGGFYPPNVDTIRALSSFRMFDEFSQNSG